MTIIQVCVGSSCHLKGAPEIVGLLKKTVEDNGLGDDVVLTGSFCTGKCNRQGVTITVNDDVYTGITPETFREFWNEKVKPVIDADR